MSEISYYEFLGTVAAVVGTPILVFFFMFNNLKDDLRKLVEAGTAEHWEFRQKFELHDALFREISEKLGEINGKMDVLIDLQRKQGQ